ncbi:MAG TPA: DsbC family protein [Solimonas sp.]|nr:DsbC family protein [Solimonas sp.]
MKHAAVTAAVAFMLGAAATACAQETELDRVRDMLSEYLPEIKKEDINPAGVPGLYEVRQGFLFGYVTADGKILIQGDMINLETGEELTENRRKRDRIALLDKLGESNMIVFSPDKPQDVKHTISVFTDIDCGYCRKFHREIADYTAQGIKVRYLFYPRTGPQSESFKKAEAVWCSSDRKMALTRAKGGAPLVGDPKCENPIQREWELGQQFQLKGTPMIVLPDGEVVNGYVPAEALAQRLTQGSGTMTGEQEPVSTVR